MHDLIVVGAGPCGLSCGAAARERDLDVVVIDRGALCESILHFPTYMTFFSTPDLLEIAGVPFALDPPLKPGRRELLAYYRAVAVRFGIPLRLYEEVVAAERIPGGFAVHTRPRRGGEARHEARALALATGYFAHPRLLGVPGEDLPHVSHWYTEGAPYFGCDVAVVGGRNSAAEAALDLHRHGARVTLVCRGPELDRSIKYWVRPDLDRRIRDGEIVALFETEVTALSPAAVEYTQGGRPGRLAADFVFALTGYVPDWALLRSLGGRIDPDMNRPRFHRPTMETEVPGLFVAGVQADPDSIIEQGRYHGPRIAETVARRREAAGTPPGPGRGGATPGSAPGPAAGARGRATAPAARPAGAGRRADEATRD